jgi:EAL domain-containing protein (putative c-di-GMP-specific phosphodiesterase class I)
MKKAGQTADDDARDGVVQAPPPERRSLWLLIGQVVEGEPIRQIPICNMPFLIGRRPDLSLSVPNRTVSAVHAEIIERSGQPVLRDLKSTNGTFVNGVPVSEEAILSDGDLLQFASVAFRLRREEARVVQQTATGDAGDQAMALLQFDKLMEGKAAMPYFQPIVRLADQQAVAYEIVGRSCLLGLKQPREMFHIAGQLNMQAELSRLFRREGVQCGKRLPGKPNLFVNTHPVEIGHSALTDSLRELRTIAPAQRITLEVHEAAVAETKTMRELRTVLNDLDIELAYDDFGAGQARLVELVEVRPDYLKFDMQLIQGLHAAPARRQQMVAALVEMARGLGIQPLAEGIECQPDSLACLQIGFQLAQGYLFGKPAPLKRYGVET